MAIMWCCLCSGGGCKSHDISANKSMQIERKTAQWPSSFIKSNLNGYISIRFSRHSMFGDSLFIFYAKLYDHWLG